MEADEVAMFCSWILVGVSECLRVKGSEVVVGDVSEMKSSCSWKETGLPQLVGGLRGFAVDVYRF